MEQANSAYQSGEVPPPYSSHTDCIVQQPTGPSQQQSTVSVPLQYTVVSLSQNRPNYKTNMGACNCLSCLVTCFCYPLVWAKIAGRVNFCCGRTSRVLWLWIMCFIVYGGYYLSGLGVRWLLLTHSHLIPWE